jgi:Cu2+-exporting ATPase
MENQHSHKQANHDDNTSMPMEDHTHHKQHDKHSGHDEHAGHHTADFLKRFWLCLVITIPVLLLSHMIQQWMGFTLAFTGDKYVLLVLSSFIYCYGGWP